MAIDIFRSGAGTVVAERVSDHEIRFGVAVERDVYAFASISGADADRLALAVLAATRGPRD